MTDSFHATVVEAVVNDPTSENGMRDARYIPASCIPQHIIAQMLGPDYTPDNKRHPHNIRGMAWDLTVGNWRNMKNAQTLDTLEDVEVAFSMDSAARFIA